MAMYRHLLMAVATVGLCFTNARPGFCQETLFKQKIKKETAPASVNRLNVPTINASNTAAAREPVHALFHKNGILLQDTSDNKHSIPKSVTEIIKSSKDGLPVYIKSVNTNAAMRIDNKQSPKEAAFSFLREISPVTGITHPADEFEVLDVVEDELKQTHIKLQQKYNGIPVYGSEIIVHLKNNEKVLNGNYQLIPKVYPDKPVISSQQATQIVKADLQKSFFFKEFNNIEKQMISGNQIETELVMYRNLRNEVALTYHITAYPNVIDRWEYFINAKSGEIIKKHNTTCTANGPKTATATDLNGVNQLVNTYEFDGKYFFIDATKTMFNLAASRFPDEPIGAIQTVDANFSPKTNINAIHVASFDNKWNNPAAVSAHYHANLVYDYFKNVHGRNSFDGKGSTIISYVNLNGDDAKAYDNAFWNGRAMFYGNGSIFKPFAGSLDVCGHELTHGVVQHSANLIYEFQPGAINESMADIFGAMIEGKNWQCGEDIVNLTYFPSGASRDMSDPHNGGRGPADYYWQPNHMSEYQNLPNTEEGDWGGVHKNSGILNYAYYLYATAVTKAKAEKVYYRALTTYLTRSSQFQDLRIAVISAATDLYGAASAEVNQAAKAFDAVGIEETSGSTPSKDIPVNPGQEYLLVYGTNTSLYRAPANISVYDLLTETDIKSKPSVTDDGKTAYFVDADSKIKRISTNPAAPQETVISDEEWDNVAISKDGKKLAAISTEIDTAIYVYDFTSQKWAKFRLYNPTFSSGEISNGPLYGDVIEWDYSGEYLIYDALNVIANAEGENVKYWDVGIIRVWNNAANRFGDGRIAKLIASLPAGVNIANPVFSKNSPHIIAYDYTDKSEDFISVKVHNLETGKSNTVATSKSLGYPTFSKQDNRIAFTDLNNEDNTVLNIVDLQADKLTPVTNSKRVFIDNTKLAVYYTEGSRNTAIALSAPEALSASNVGSNEFTARWNTVSNASSYLLDVSTNINFTSYLPNYQGKAITGISDTITGLQNNTKYYYRLRARNNSTTSAYSNIIEVATLQGTITITSISHAVICAGNSMSVAFTTNTGFTANNTFTVQLSNSSGSFANPVAIGNVSGTAGSTVNVNIPSATTPGTGYRVRVVSSSPVITSKDNGGNLTVNAVPPKPTVSISAPTDSATVSLTSSIAEAYQWMRNGNIITGATARNYNVTQPGSYTVQINAGGCTNISEAVVLTANDYVLLTEQKIRFYPNPVADGFTITFPAKSTSSQAKVTVFNNLGVKLDEYQMQRQMDSWHLQVGVRQYAKGYYIVVITDGEISYTKTFIKQ